MFKVKRNHWIIRFTVKDNSRMYLSDYNLFSDLWVNDHWQIKTVCMAFSAENFKDRFKTWMSEKNQNYSYGISDRFVMHNTAHVSSLLIVIYHSLNFIHLICRYNVTLIICGRHLVYFYATIPHKTTLSNSFQFCCFLLSRIVANWQLDSQVLTFKHKITNIVIS